MADLIPFADGGYAFLKGVFPYSQGVKALPGYAIERLRFARLPSIAEGFEGFQFRSHPGGGDFVFCGNARSGVNQHEVLVGDDVQLPGMPAKLESLDTVSTRARRACNTRSPNRTPGRARVLESNFDDGGREWILRYGANLEEIVRNEDIGPEILIYISDGDT